YKNLKKWCEASWKRDKRFSKVTDEAMGTTEGESLLFHLDEFIDDGALQYLPELDAIIAPEMYFEEGDTTGRGYFDLLGDYGTYSISKNEQGTIISLKGDPEVKEDDLVDDSDPAIQDLKTKIDAYEYYYDTKGNLMKVKGKVRRNLYNKDFVIERIM
ncbi:MAG: hypothetical protein ACFNZ2_07320, partial [Prevotella histicola]